MQCSLRSLVIGVPVLVALTSLLGVLVARYVDLLAPILVISCYGMIVLTWSFAPILGMVGVYQLWMFVVKEPAPLLISAVLGVIVGVIGAILLSLLIAIVLALF